MATVKQVANMPSMGIIIRLDAKVPIAAPKISDPHMIDVQWPAEYLFCSNLTATGNWHPIKTPATSIIR